jgi:phosphonate transport system substrate-binding protein
MPSGLWPCVVAVLALLGCGDPAPSGYLPSYSQAPPARDGAAEYVFAVHPLHNPKRLFEVYQPLVRLINDRAGSAFRLKLEASRNYAAFEEKFYAGKFHFALPNPYQTVIGEERGYRIVAKMGDDERFRGIIVVRRDSRIETIADLRGAAISFPAPTALAGTMMPKLLLHSLGIDFRDIELRYVGSQESAIMNVYLGKTKAASTWPPPWELLSQRRPEVAQELVVKWQTDSLVNNGIVVRKDVPEQHWRIAIDTFLTLHTHEAGRLILRRMDLSRFEDAESATYEPVRQFLKTYEVVMGRI